MVASLLIFAGCSSIPKEQKLVSPQVDLINQGIVLGEIIRPDAALGLGLVIEEENSHEKYTISYAKKFILKLPPGHYRISSISGFNHPIRPLDDQNAIAFTVKQSEVKYIGSLVGNYVANQKVIEEFLLRGAVLSKRVYVGYADVGFTSYNFSNEKIMVYIVNNLEQVRGEFFTQYPGYKEIPIQSSEFIEPGLFKREQN